MNQEPGRSNSQQSHAPRSGSTRASHGKRNKSLKSHISAVTLRAVSAVAADVLSGNLEPSVLNHFTRAAIELTGAEYAAIGITSWNHQGKPFFASDGIAPEVADKLQERPCFTGILRWIIDHKMDVVLDDVREHPGFAGFPEHHPIMGPLLGCPVMLADSPIGCMYLANSVGGKLFTAEDLEIARSLCLHIGVATRVLHMQARQRSMVRELIRSQEEERKSVAYDLHDGVFQYVMAAHAHIEGFVGAKDPQSDTAHRMLENSAKCLDTAAVEARRMLNGLRPASLEELGLDGALDLLLDSDRERFGWQYATLTSQLGLRRFSDSVETSIYRIAQEALTNAGKYAKTPGVTVDLSLSANRRGEESLELVVTDFGKGFKADAGILLTQHIGIHGMRERAELLDGSFEITSRPGEGTTVHVIIPLR